MNGKLFHIKGRLNRNRSEWIFGIRIRLDESVKGNSGKCFIKRKTRKFE